MKAFIAMTDLRNYDLPLGSAERAVLRQAGFDMRRPYEKRPRPDLGFGIIEFTQEVRE